VAVRSDVEPVARAGRIFEANQAGGDRGASDERVSADVQCTILRFVGGSCQRSTLLLSAVSTT
jgi:hypothetical protein